MIANVILALCLILPFVVIEYFMVRSALRTKSLDDPLMQRSLVGVIAQRSMFVRIVFGTIGALILGLFIGISLASLIFAALGIEPG
jgi:hypothetical protein